MRLGEEPGNEARRRSLGMRLGEEPGNEARGGAWE